VHGKDGGDGLVWMVVAAALEALEAAVMVVPVKLLIVGQQATVGWQGLLFRTITVTKVEII